MLNLCKISSHDDKRCFPVGKADFLRGAKFSPPPGTQASKKGMVLKGLRTLGVPARKVFRQLKNVSNPSQGLSSPKKIYDSFSKHKKKELGPSFGATGSEQMLKIFRDMQLYNFRVSSQIFQWYVIGKI